MRIRAGGLLGCWVSSFLLTVVSGMVSQRTRIGVSVESGVRERTGMTISSFFFRSPWPGVVGELVLWAREK